MAIPPLVVLEDIGLFPGATQWIDLAVEQLQRRRDELVKDGNEAEQLARRIGRTMTLIHGGGSIGATAAQRWKTQINENAKAPAFWAAQPELCHNEIQGWGQHGDVTRQVLTLLALRHDSRAPAGDAALRPHRRVRPRGRRRDRGGATPRATATWPSSST